MDYYTPDICTIPMKLLANEIFPLASVKYLIGKGFDVVAIGIDFAGYEDTEVMDLAQKEQRIILTFDRDYGELIFKHHYHPEKESYTCDWKNMKLKNQERSLNSCYLFAKLILIECLPS